MTRRPPSTRALSWRPACRTGARGCPTHGRPLPESTGRDPAVRRRRIRRPRRASSPRARGSEPPRWRPRQRRQRPRKGRSTARTGGEPKRSAVETSSRAFTTSTALADPEELSRLDVAAHRVGAVGPPHVHLVHLGRGTKAESAAAGRACSCTSRPAAMSRHWVRSPTRTVTRVPIGLISPRGPSHTTVSHDPPAVSLAEERRRLVGVRDEQIEIPVVVVVASRNASTRPHLLESRPGLSRRVAEHRRLPGPRFSSSKLRCA